MDITQQGVVTLLRSAITGERHTLPEGFALEAADNLVQKQGLLPMVYQGAYLCGIDVKSEIMQRYQKLYFRHLLHSEQQMRKVVHFKEALPPTGDADNGRRGHSDPKRAV